MAETLWQHADNNLQSQTTWFTILNDVQIVLGTAQDKIAIHNIVANELSIPANATLLNFSPSFDLVPNQYPDAAVMQRKVANKHQFLPEIIIRSYTNENDHLLPYVLLQQALKSEHKHTVEAHASDTNLTLVFVSEGQCMLANSFTIKDIKEVVYFFTQISNQHGLSISDIHFNIHTSLEQSEILRNTQDYITNLEFVVPNLPYQAHQMPPYAAETYLLYLLSQCELPEAS